MSVDPRRSLVLEFSRETDIMALANVASSQLEGEEAKLLLDEYVMID